MQTLGRYITINAVAASTLRTITEHGGFEQYLLLTKDRKLSTTMQKLKKEIVATFAELMQKGENLRIRSHNNLHFFEAFEKGLIEDALNNSPKKPKASYKS